MTGTPTTRGRYRGCLLGLACGEAVGLTQQHMARHQCRKDPVSAMVGGGPYKLRPGQWGGCTAMAFALGDRIADFGFLDPAHVLNCWEWWAFRDHRAYTPTGRGCFDLDGETAAAIGRWRETGETGETAGRVATGNRALGRLAPAVMAFVRPGEDGYNRDAAVSVAFVQGSWTHNSPQSDSCCRVIAEMLTSILSGRGFLAGGFPALLKTLDGEVANRLRERNFLIPGDRQIKSIDYCVDTLEAALWAVCTTGDFEAAVLAAANLGGESATVAAVAGQLAGAWYGADGIPAAWLATLDRGDELVNLADRLADVAGVDRERLPEPPTAGWSGLSSAAGGLI